MGWVKKRKNYDHVNAHGIKKWSATEASANTVEASLALIFHRGEWLLGIVLDIYWKMHRESNQV